MWDLHGENENDGVQPVRPRSLSRLLGSASQLSHVSPQDYQQDKNVYLTNADDLAVVKKTFVRPGYHRCWCVKIAFLCNASSFLTFRCFCIWFLLLRSIICKHADISLPYMQILYLLLSASPVFPLGDAASKTLVPNCDTVCCSDQGAKPMKCNSFLFVMYSFPPEAGALMFV